MSASIDLGAQVENFAGDLVTIDDPAMMQPTPLVWPVCDTRHAPYVLRLPLFVFNGPRSWVWQRDCDKPRSTCKRAGFELHDAKGVVPQEGRS